MFRTHPLEVPARLSALRARVWMRVRRPEGIGEGTRWLFVVLVLASLLLTLPAPLTAANGTLRLVAVAGAVVLGLSWGAGYLRRSAPLAMDLVDAVALLAFALASPEPTIVFPLVFAALWFRSLYGSGRRAVLRCGLYAGALGASLPLWPYVPGHTGGTEIAPLVGTFPAMFLTVIVGRHLAVCDRRHHGGDTQAVYAYAREDLDHWESVLGRNLPGGVFGENLTTMGVDVNAAVIGERWRIGDELELAVTVPRIPCGTFRGWIAEQGWLRTFARAAMPGTYLSVVSSGQVRAGDPVTVLHRPAHGVTVARVFRAVTLEPALLPSILAAEGLDEETKEMARQRRTFALG